MRATTLTFTAAAALSGVVDAATTEEWKSRAIYQVVVDRFAKSDSSTTAECSDLSQFCNGTWTGLIDNLDYIQGRLQCAQRLASLLETNGPISLFL